MPKESRATEQAREGEGRGGGSWGGLSWVCCSVESHLLEVVLHWGSSQEQLERDIKLHTCGVGHSVGVSGEGVSGEGVWEWRG